MSGGAGSKQALGRLHPGPGRDPALSPDADRNVLSQSPILLVILVNVSLNTLPVLAFRLIHQTLKKPRPKVRGPGLPAGRSPDPEFVPGKDSDWLARS